MKKFSSIFLIVLFSVFLNASEDIEDMLEEGESLFKATCVTCHGLDGMSNNKLNLIVKPRKLSQTILSKEQVKKIITMGANHYGAHSDIMPSFKSVFSKREIESIALYVNERFLQKRHAEVDELLKESKNLKADINRGKKIYKRNCSLCHGINGDAKSEYVEISKQSDMFLYPYNLQKILLNEEQIFLFVKYGGKYWGTHRDDMASWGKKYSDEDLKSVAKYVNEKIKIK